MKLNFKGAIKDVKVRDDVNDKRQEAMKRNSLSTLCLEGRCNGECARLIVLVKLQGEPAASTGWELWLERVNYLVLLGSI